MRTKPLRPGDKVRYHGSITSHHGEYIVVGFCDADEPCSRRCGDDESPYVRYVLEGCPQFPETRITCVREISVTPLSEDGE